MHNSELTAVTILDKAIAAGSLYLEHSRELDKRNAKAAFLSWGQSGTPFEWTVWHFDKALPENSDMAHHQYYNPMSVQSILLLYAGEYEINSLGKISEFLGCKIAEWAEKDAHTEQLVRYLITTSAKNGTPLPNSLHDLVDRVLSGEVLIKKHGPKAWRFFNRNRVAAMALNVLSKPEGFSVSGGYDPEYRVSTACHMVSEASRETLTLSMTPNAVDEVWRNLDRWLFEVNLFGVIARHLKVTPIGLPTTFALSAIELLERLSGKKSSD